ncbi:carbohydrate-binding family 9-like protein [Dyadobacter tibetensis]|uniref:carbohydrate-binding family 9-like protein n=1 Tax=Dyadobacter tibetensis TaxID=1211851 RepID=UPI001E2D815C|nr:carbohydrate-binding family 9-like protein [Dyadobacter tibetensis]
MIMAKSPSSKFILVICVFSLLSLSHVVLAQLNVEGLRIKKTIDFTVDGKGTANAWKSIPWNSVLPQKGPGQLRPGKNFTTKFKVLYSEKGIYCLFQASDSLLSASITEDFGLLYKEDVVEVFLWPDVTQPLYFEYELSPLNYELAIIVPNINGKIQGWRPWIYTDKNRVQHATSVQGGSQKSGEVIQGWVAEIFIPYSLLQPMVQSAPKKGDLWKGNFYRIDYDNEPTYYSWKATEGSFHDMKNFGTLIFD